MAFQANNAFLGVPDFGIVDIDPIETAKAFQKYLDTASNLTGVALDDINLNVVKLPADQSKVTLVELLEAGMKLFDALVWLTANRPKTHPLKLDPTMDKKTIPTLHDVARSVFYCYFMLLTQARYPVSSRSTEKPKIPNFLKTIMGMDQEQHHYVEMICSFEPQKFNPAWAQYVSFKKFGQEVLSRFGLGVAGYRMFGPFKLYRVKKDMDPELADAVQFAQTVAKAPASWAIHPLTRAPDVLAARGNLNKNLSNLILECFTETEIDEMVTKRIIYAKPVRDPAHMNYKTWTSEDDISGTAKIFRI